MFSYFITRVKKASITFLKYGLTEEKMQELITLDTLALGFRCGI